MDAANHRVGDHGSIDCAGRNKLCEHVGKRGTRKGSPLFVITLLLFIKMLGGFGYLHYLCSEIQKPSIMNLNLTSTIKMPDHQLRRQVIDLCKKVEKPLLKLSTKDYVDNGLGHLVEEFDGQAGLVNIEAIPQA